jgi:hypothetical protein
MVQRYNGTMVQWYNGIMVQWYNGTLLFREVFHQEADPVATHDILNI